MLSFGILLSLAGFAIMTVVGMLSGCLICWLCVIFGHQSFRAFVVESLLLQLQIGLLVLLPPLPLQNVAAVHVPNSSRRNRKWFATGRLLEGRLFCFPHLRPHPHLHLGRQ